MDKRDHYRGQQPMRRGESILNYFSTLIIAFCAIAISFAAALLTKAPLGYELIMFLCWIVGLGLFLKSKISVYKQGRLLSFGSAGMTNLNRFCYRAGYVLMLIALSLSLILYAFFRANPQ
jgi:hypothetical protein